MKPGFALDLDHDRIALLHRRTDGWLRVGEVALDDPALEAKLTELKRKAGVLAPDGITTKLIIPASQILYTEVDAPGPDRASRRAQIARALEGLTPYRLDELVYDWSRVGGGKVRVAAVARVTLDEAERFAEDFGFCPVAFVACPERGGFAGEPFFGATTGSGQHLPAGEKLERDQDPVREIGTLPPNAFEIEDISGPDITKSPPETGDSGDLADEAEPAIAAEPPAAATAHDAEADVAADAEPHAEAVSESVAEPEVAAAPEEFTAVEREVEELPDAGAQPADPEAAETVREAGAPDTDQTVSEEAEAATGDDAELGAASDGLAVPEDDADTDAEEAPEVEQNAPIGTIEAVTAFATRRAGLETGTEGIAATSRLTFAEADLPAAPKIGPATGRLGITDPILAIPDADDRSDNGAGGPRRPRNRLGRALVDNLPEVKHGTQAQLKQRWAAETGLPETAEMTSFGARRQTTAARSRTRLAFVLIALLLLIMAAVAAWSVFRGSASDQTPAATSESAVPEAPGAAVGVTDPSPTDEADAAPETAVPEAAPAVTPQPDLAIASPEPDALPTTESSSAPDAVEPAAAEPTLTGPPPAAEQVAPALPSTAESQAADDSGAALVTRDAPAPESQLSAGLPTLETVSADTQPTPQPLPPPAGTVYEFGPDGLIKPTEEGVVTPDGFTLISGKPPVAPPPRPGSEAVVVPAPDPAEATSAPDEQGAIDTPAPDPALAAIKPRSRPERIVALAEAATAQRSAIDDAAAAAAAAEESTTFVSAQAVVSSRRPAQRPSGFSSAVEAAIAAAVAEPQPAPAQPAAPQPEPQVAAAPAQVELDEPEPMEAVPNMPTSRTVSNQATIKNAINLGEINLIGVYGSSSSRRALVRMPNGRYVKLRVGDRFDGGKVAAIGDSELSYVKRGKTIVLKIVKKG